MSNATVLGLIEHAGTSMTVEEGFDFIERSRRQLDRFAVANPDARGMRIVPEHENEIRMKLDVLEADLLALQHRH